MQISIDEINVFIIMLLIIELKCCLSYHCWKIASMLGKSHNTYICMLSIYNKAILQFR